MAVSPPVSRSPNVGTATSPNTSHAKSLAVRRTTTGGAAESVPAIITMEGKAKGSEPELAEQLNAEIRHRYVKDKKLGEGTYAIVYLGHLRSDPSSLVAIKKIKVNTEYKDGLSMDAIREVKYLQELSHPNVIALHAVFSSKDRNLNLVLEYLPLGDLEMLIKDSAIQYGAADVKAWVGMLGRAVWFCHENFILHRDIKPNNLLIASDGEVKLADFGLARSFADPRLNMTHQVITRWYRPLELLYGARQYSGAVDVWSMGMVFAELLLRVPFAAGNTDLDQISKICAAFGTPTEDNWPGVTKLPNFVPVEKNQIVPLQGRDFFLRQFPTVGHLGADLLSSMLKLDPRNRSTAKQILQHAWWSAEPRPTRKENLPRKAGGAKKMGNDLSRRGGVTDEGPFKNAARRLDFGGLLPK
ncbi:TFIIH complex serine/threonine-protein kinase subunit kin28 [Coccidioides posadasii str. Silveira]|uniref:Serine/threonine-protein kinase crk1 n=2 Tax=Coccidioides posadasii TaxID=199306 RepID=E9DGX9_COCPS|nr:serine/threonine protein kinase crk1, putative [Coccidioides posadasii C735 delta SOWgp]EER25999.1 serine/threonine protein kinase crk1, putative [Coccidioides posadasii C735 delta SOWgp]EFW14490.1 serine/threonine-protein kinase crk1 [Coccidioides posadasii str. Silveira]QVM13729.1 TFIIH complex serine/threonine-protein kinase subunit kin28 [Coccidioides posadasii str. Silveira]|eukprot:XP_003068144.1 serine/threonine protein kinase crk1, putative [Coccidioides posadasii C735 delta SOWgp]